MEDLRELDENVLPSRAQPDACSPAVPKELIYHPELRPDGVRCGFHDNLVNLVGRDRATGLARRALDNLGVQYGLKAFNDGLIHAEQFIELNATIGGYDADGNIVPERSRAGLDALRVLYRTGRVNSGGGSLGAIPIIDTRRYQDPSGNIHDRVRILRDRRQIETGKRHLCQPSCADGSPAELGCRTADGSVAGLVAEDESGGEPAAVISGNRPAALSDACWSAEGERFADAARHGAAGPAATSTRRVGIPGSQQGPRQRTTS